MRPLPVRAAAVALVVLVTACEPSLLTPTTIPAPSESTVPTATEAPGTSTVDDGRPLRIVGCDPAVAEVEIVCETYQLVRRHYVDPVSDADLANAAGQGLAELNGARSDAELTCAAPAGAFQEVCARAADEAEDSNEAAEAMVFGMTTFGLDPNSVYFDPEARELIEEEQTGQIEGIGALVTAEDETGELCSVLSATCRLFIVSTIEGTPAEEAGLQPDDILIGVNGEDIERWTLDEVTATVRGPAGTEVVLTIERGERIFDVAITRAEFTVPVIDTEVVDNAGYVALTTFTDNADELFEDAVSDLIDQGIDSLVVDLRNNPGGLLDTAIEIASDFLPDGDVVVTESPDSSTSYPVSGDPIVPADMKVVVVVNRGSASASEVVSAVLQERGRVTLVGENTFGKNTVQQRFALSNGGALKLTIARWLTPGGLDFGSVGVTPDVEKDLDVGLSVEAVVREALAASVTVATG